MTHDHPAAAELVPLPGPVAAVATAASLFVAFLHLRRLHRTPWPGVTNPDGWIEAGHAVVAVGMAIMFVAPAEVVGSWPFLAVYLVVTAALLVALVAHPRCGAPALWSCCALLLVEAAAMACMSGSTGIARWPLRTDGALGTWCVVLFGGAFLTALVGLPARRLATATTPPMATATATATATTQLAAPSTQLAAGAVLSDQGGRASQPRAALAALLRAFPDPVVPRASRLVMSGGMVLMFLSQSSS
ncbi:DUF5134 domain-containing protein [Parafrankia colletiae]|uniref:DUF5134 domain-containing protein n=1 Tax=Parafrankia colletiae TaxID=573497 RepID=A0A1S1QIT6_9ACTN|nr:DUF5134 domain-containing protein [Parafrankia colletiae]MCK9900582.1 DUF5134 domain-containing protein [Frankia sp. Cpl3]OHV34688.1 DUF5134 domain-containing protein [Parafrankia colletiae]